MECPYQRETQHRTLGHNVKKKVQVTEEKCVPMKSSKTGKWHIESIGLRAINPHKFRNHGLDRHWRYDADALLAGALGKGIKYEQRGSKSKIT